MSICGTTLVSAWMALAALLACGCSDGDPEGPFVCTPEAAGPQLSGTTIDRARALADSWIERHPPASLSWNWEEAVLMNGVAALYDATGEQRYIEYVQGWVDHHLGAGYALTSSDTCAPAAAAAQLYRRTCDDRYSGVVEAVHSYLIDEAPRTAEGGINHLGPIMTNIPQIWIDSLYMFGMPMIWGQRYTGGEGMLALIAEQMEVFSEVLQDHATGLYRHASINATLVPAEAVFWARGNSWVLVAMAELLSDDPGRQGIRSRFDRLSAALLARQVPGEEHWYTVLDNSRPTYIETSGSAMIIHGVARAIGLGLIDAKERKRLDRAIPELMKRVVTDTSSGDVTVTGTSIGTMPGDFTYYSRVSQEDDVPFGVGAVLMALVEYQRLLAEGT